MHTALPNTTPTSRLLRTRRGLLAVALSGTLLSTLSIPLLTPLPAWAQPAKPTPPTAPVRNVPETFFGTAVDDPYRDFENAKAPAVAAWMKAHSDHAQATLKRISGRSALRDQLERFEGATAARVNGVVRLPGDIIFFERRGATEDQFKLYMRRGLAGKDQLLFDPETLKKKTGKPHAINWYAAAPDGSRVAVGVSAAGSEEATLRMLDTQSGRQIGPIIERAQFGGASWSPDNRELYFHRMQPLKNGMPATDKYQRSMAVVMKPGGSEASIRTLIRAGEPGAIDVPATEFPFIEVHPDGRVIAQVMDGVSAEFRAYHSTLAKLRAGQPQWQKLFDREDAVTALAVKGDRAYVLSHKGASRFRLLGGPVDGFAPATARVLVPESERVLTGIGAAQDALYVEARDGNVKRLFKLAHSDGAPLQDVALPVVGAFALANSTRADLPGALIDLQGWTRARQIFFVAPDGRVTNTGLQPAGPFDAPGDVVASEVMVKSHDGVMVPLSIIHKAGVKLDGRNPTLLYGYASYGITEEPFFSISRLAWMDAGGVFAVANPRGSSVFGKQWHEDGRKASKPNTWRDFIACAEYLIAQKWTEPARLAIWGGSAGGILVGRAMTERPDLFGVVLPEVGALDMVRAETTPNGIPNIPEFGSRATEPGFRALLAMSTYHQIKDGVNYPAVMFVHGVNDPRVEVWNSTKTAARLMAATTSGKPVLLRLDYDSGHGVGNTKAQTLNERADLFAFTLWQMGVPGFELK
ncbi:MAG: prolyl oligopeptidase family serine peptidase [Rubrivivax sp.]|nr:prolyl oligopeptidase family serine peptidase [Rubrivivax sp.]